MGGIVSRHNRDRMALMWKNIYSRKDNAMADFNRFTREAQEALRLAREEAQRLGHGHTGTEHLLIAVVRQDGQAAKVLANLGVDLQKVLAGVEFLIGRGNRRPETGGDIRLTPRAERVIDLAIDEMYRLNHVKLGAEHILLGLIREGEGIAAGVLESLGVPLEKVRAEVAKETTA